MRLLLLVIVALLVPAAPALAQASQRCFIGYAYHLDTGDFAYTETHHQTLKNGQPVTWQITYRDTQGNTIAIKTMHFKAHPFVPVYRLEILADGYVEGIRHDGGWVMYRREHTGADVETKAFAISPPMAGDSGFAPFVQAHFDALMDGQTLTFSFVVAGRLDVIDMQAYRIQDTSFEGKPAVQFKVDLDSWLLNLFVNPIILVYSPDTQRLLEYRGISNMHGSDGEPYPVRVSYYAKPPPEADRAAAYCDDR